jgi:DNA repair protein RadC
LFTRLPSTLDRCNGGLFVFIMEPTKQYTVTEITVAYRNKQKARERPIVSSSSDAFNCLLKGYDPDLIGLQEQFVVMYLNVSNRVLGVYRAAKGGLTGTVSDIRLILSVGLKVAATSLVISHNHPSGNLKPSRLDEELTRKLKDAAKMMDLKLLDHLIVEPTGTEYYSFADEGLL